MELPQIVIAELADKYAFEIHELGSINHTHEHHKLRFQEWYASWWRSHPYDINPGSMLLNCKVKTILGDEIYFVNYHKLIIKKI